MVDGVLPLAVSMSRYGWPCELPNTRPGGVEALRNAEAPVGIVSLAVSEVNVPPGNPEPAADSVPVKPPLPPAIVHEVQVPAAARAGIASTTAAAAVPHRMAGSDRQRLPGACGMSVFLSAGQCWRPQP